MQEERCEECGSKVVPGLVCDCPPDRTAEKARRRATSERHEWRTFAPDTILVSQTKYAHIPGACDHVSEEYVKAPEWGWIPNPSPGLWGRVGRSHPVTATEGNTQRVADRRCSSCEARLSVT
ncbi:hypothetical protein [Streptomyces sp. ISL-100]|uniref:hypothetical protein n=1 Tax=Streptomyces sp. ISL-100 TaxID=2819173 RepID=UPI001BE82F46|nr:hypothetical protein [Streptomyces sp. ISL-100]MBT2397218.1 hypothetical protein [Streptomyces sp. ISL-100]